MMVTRRTMMIAGSVALLLPVELAKAHTATLPIPRDAFAALEKASGGRLGVSVLDTGTGARAAWRGDERFAMSSTFKALLAGAVLARVDDGVEMLHREAAIAASDVIIYSPVIESAVGGTLTVEALCHAIVTVSDNGAANLLLATMNGPGGMTALLRAWGDNVTHLDRVEPDLNEAAPGDLRDTTTPDAMAATLGVLLTGDALTPMSRERLAGWLVANTTGDARLRAGIPKGWTVGDKTGTGGQGSVNDVAVLYPPGRAPVIVAAYLTETNRSVKESSAIHAEIGRLVATAYGG